MGLALQKMSVSHFIMMGKIFCHLCSALVCPRACESSVSPLSPQAHPGPQHSLSGLPFAGQKDVIFKLT